MSRKTALVDFDGTLVDSMPYWLALPTETLRREHLPEPENFYERICTRPMWELTEYFASVRPNTTAEGLRAMWENMMLEHYLHDISLKDGALDLLALLREHGLRVVLFSATRKPYLTQAAEHFGLYPYLDDVITEEEVGAKHEQPTYERLAARFGCAIEEMLLIEDSPPNLRTAKAVGLASVAVYDESKRQWWESICADADVILPTLTALDPLRSLIS